jgi:hypothetical protein
VHTFLSTLNDFADGHSAITFGGEKRDSISGHEESSLKV